MHKLDKEHLCRGAELICISAGVLSSEFTVGSVYGVHDIMFDCHYIIYDDTGYGWWFSVELVNEDSDYPSFYPLSSLSDEEIFLFRMTGKIPDDYLR